MNLKLKSIVGALSLIASMALRPPTACGANRTFSVPDCPGASVNPLMSAVGLNSPGLAPEKLTE